MSGKASFASLELSRPEFANSGGSSVFEPPASEPASEMASGHPPTAKPR